eukprot:1191506-Prorocentrum_minimum.AAC.2
MKDQFRSSVCGLPYGWLINFISSADSTVRVPSTLHRDDRTLSTAACLANFAFLIPGESGSKSTRAAASINLAECALRARRLCTIFLFACTLNAARRVLGASGVWVVSEVRAPRAGVIGPNAFASSGSSAPVLTT